MALKSTETSTPAATSSQAGDPNLNGDTNDAADEENTIEPDQDVAALVPDTGETGEGGKLKMIMQLLKRCLGVKDLAAMRLSLPASLLEPIPNLEYWQYLDRPDLFVSINDSEDPLERMLAVIRFTFTKDLKFIRGKIVKPYNSVLGEHFRAHWDVLPVEYPPDYPSSPPTPRQHTTSPQPSANPSSVFGKGPKDESTLSFRSSKSFSSKKRASSIFDFATARVTPLPKSSGPASPVTNSPKVNGITAVANNTGNVGAVESNLAAGVSNLSLGGASGSAFDSGEEGEESAQHVRVAFLTEQISHHPPISAYYATCPARGVSMMGIDQISARVSGASVRISPGSQNKGIFVQLRDGPGKGEQYDITHPCAMVNGMLRGNFYATISESTIITCSGIAGEDKGRERLRAILEYKDESWLGNAKFAVEGVVHKYLEGDETHKEWTKVKHVHKSAALAYFEGSWRGRIRWRRAEGFTPASSASSPPSTSNASSNSDGEDTNTLIDMSTLLVIPKQVKPLHKQHAYESRKLWENVTRNLLAKEYSEATRHKHSIEQRQRDKAAERKKKGEEHIPAFFEKNIDSGIPILTPEGRKALEDELKLTDGEI
ncbi:hypothetical protein ACEPAI_7709 [Sanghuangporus weigelae]